MNGQKKTAGVRRFLQDSVRFVRSHSYLSTAKALENQK